MNLGLWADLKKMVLRKMGYRQACREIDQLTSYHGTMEDVEWLRARYNCAHYIRKKDLVDGPYRSGWNDRWYEFGWQDATKGLCRARNYRNHAYNRGWTNSVESMRQGAQRAAQLEQHFTDMKTQYWDKIGSGKSDEYYDQMNEHTKKAIELIIGDFELHCGTEAKIFTSRADFDTFVDREVRFHAKEYNVDFQKAKEALVLWVKQNHPAEYDQLS
jgi:hypothetical protein